MKDARKWGVRRIYTDGQMRPITITVPPDLIERLEEVLKSNYEGRSEFIRRVILKELDRLERAKNKA